MAKLTYRPIVLIQVVGLFLLLSCRLEGQALDGEASFILTGVSLNLPPKHKLFVYGGYNREDGIKAAVVLPFFNVHKHLILMPAYMFVNISPDDGGTFNEHHSLASAILRFPMGERLVLSDRNMYFRRFRYDAEDIVSYRNRLDLTYNTRLENKSLSLFVNNEVYLDFDGGGVSRNRLTLGGRISLFKWLTPQIWYMLQHDKGRTPRHLLFLFLTVPLENWGVFHTKNTTAIH